MPTRLWNASEPGKENGISELSRVSRFKFRSESVLTYQEANQIILKQAPPTNLKKTCAFLGTINFIKNHIQHCLAIMEPITRLT